MKKILLLAILLMAVSVVGLQAYDDVYFHVSSDNTCDTVFYVGAHDEMLLVVWAIRVNDDLTPLPGEEWEYVHTFEHNEHYYSTSSMCANFRYLYKLTQCFVPTFPSASSQLYHIKAEESTAVGQYCRSCADYSQESTR